MSSARTAPAALILTLLAACAMPGPPFPTPDPTPDPALRPSVAITEGQPRGLLLDLRLPDDPTTRDATTRLALLRQIPPGEFEVHFTFDRDEPSPLWDQGRVTFMDQDLTPGTTYRYAVAIQLPDQPTRTSDAEALVWSDPPEPPEGLEARATGKHMVLEWTPREGEGAVVFRRTVGKKGYARLGMSSAEDGGAFVDSAIAPGTVYAYMISAVRFEEGRPLIGRPCAEVYTRSERTGPIAPASPDPPVLKNDTK